MQRPRYSNRVESLQRHGWIMLWAEPDDMYESCQCGSAECEEDRIVERDGAWGIVGYVADPSMPAEDRDCYHCQNEGPRNCRDHRELWTAVDSVWGFAGDTFYGSGYDSDVLESAANAFTAAWRAAVMVEATAI